MLITAIFTVISYLLAMINAVQGLINFILPDYLVSWISEATNILIVANGFFPIGASLKVFGIFLAIEIGFLLLKAITGLISLVRGGGNMQI